MTKKMKSYRLSEDTDLQIKDLAKVLGESEAEIITLAIDWLHCSGFAQAVVDNKKRDGYSSAWRAVTAVSQDTKNQLKADIWINA